MSDDGWRFLVDRGGTFTDVVATRGALRVVRKVLSDDGSGEDPTIRALREITGLDEPGPATAGVRMGTTIATNALLERAAAPTALAITRGLEDLIFDLVPDDGSSALRDEVELKFPTAAFAVLELPAARWADVAEGSARFVHLTRPRDLDPTLGPELVS